MGELSDKDLEHFRALLVAKRAEVTALLEAAVDDAAPVKLDQTSVGRLSRMDAMQQQAMALETRRRRLTEIERIDAALARMDEGEYGYCVLTGEPIDRERLELDPAAPTIVQKKG